MLRAEERGRRRGVLLIMATIRHATPEDLPAVLALLRDSGLPYQDIDAGKMPDYVVASQDDAVLGAVGVEVYGEHGLLRSLVVGPEARAARIGTALRTAMERHAKERGVTSLYLLTTTAEAFFTRSGYRMLDRKAAPPALQATTEFSSLCPSQAVCMVLDLRNANAHDLQNL